MLNNNLHRINYIVGDDEDGDGACDDEYIITETIYGVYDEKKIVKI